MNYIDDFWAASRTLERQDKGAKDQAELPGLEKQFGKAHLNQLEAQRKGDLAEITNSSQSLIKQLQQPPASETLLETAPLRSVVGKWIRWKLRRTGFEDSGLLL